MSDLTDPAAASAAVADPGTSAVDLSLIAQHHPQLRSQVAIHPAAYPGLLDWLAGLGDPMVAAAVAVRRDADRAAATGMNQPPAAQPVRAAAPAPSVLQPSTGPVPFAQVVQPGGTWAGAAQAPQPVPPAGGAKPRKRLLIGVAAAVVVVALVAGFTTRGFGLLRFGGAASPEEEAVKVAEKTVGLLNSFSLKNLLSNPYSALGDLSDEIAPSEAGLTSNFTKVDNSDLLVLSNDSINLAADLLGAFTLKADGLKTEVTQITDEIAQVGFVEGEISVTADTERLKEGLKKFPDVAAAQVETTLAKYGLTPNKSVEFDLPSGWSDDLLGAVRDNFPYRVDLSDCAAWLTSGESNGDSALASICPLIGQVVVVKEAGKWYLSPMLSWSFSIGGVSDYGTHADFADPERQEMLRVTAAQHGEPIDAAVAVIPAVVKGGEPTILAELPLGERRYAAATGLLAGASLAGYSTETHFTEIARSGNQAKLRIDQLKLSNGSGDVEITDGTCINFFGNSGCLSDVTNSDALDSAFSSLKGQDWTSFEESTGVSADKVIRKLETATRAALKAIDPDQIGVVVVQENGGWLVSFAASYAELQNQIASALRVGLLSIQE